MNKILILTTLAITLNGCRFVHLKEPYLEAESSPALEIPEGSSAPNASSLLEVPEASNKKEITQVPNSTPPEMPIRTKQSENDSIRIVNRDGFAVVVAKHSQDQVWEAMETLNLENWTQESSNQESCELTLKYDDIAARERENAGFLKKLFTRDKYYKDYTGFFSLACKVRGSVTEVQFNNQDGTKAKTFLADSVMNALFEKLDEK